MAFTKITKDMNVIAALPDEPNDVGGLSAAELKAKFDEAGLDIKEKFNGLIDALAAATGAGNLGAKNPDGTDATSLQTVLNSRLGIEVKTWTGDGSYVTSHTATPVTFTTHSKRLMLVFTTGLINTTPIFKLLSVVPLSQENYAQEGYGIFAYTGGKDNNKFAKISCKGSTTYTVKIWATGETNSNDAEAMLNKNNYDYYAIVL